MLPNRNEVRSKVGGWPLAAGITVVLVFLFFIRHILLPFILAAALAFVLTPVVDALHRRVRIPRWISALIVYLCVLLVVGLLAYMAGGSVIRDVAGVIRTFPQTVHKLISEVAGLGVKITGHPLNATALTKEVLGELRSLTKSGLFLSLAGYGFMSVFGGVLLLVLLIYFLISGKTIAAGVFWLVPPEYREEVNIVAAKILPLLWRYFLGLLVIVTYTSSIAWVGFSLVFHLPRAPLLAIVVGVLELVPLIGPATSLGIVSLLAIHQTGLLAIAGLMGFAIALRLSIDQLMAPLVLGEAARVHPVVIIFSFLSGAVLFGIVGLLLAVPVAASLKIILTIYYAEPVAERQPESRAARAG